MVKSSNRKAQLLATATAIAIAFGLNTLAYAGGASYDDCVLENLKGVESDVAARSIVAACRSKYPSKSNDEPDALDTEDFFIGQLRVDLFGENLTRREAESVRAVDYVEEMNRGPDRWPLSDGRILRFMNRNSFALGGVLIGLPFNRDGDSTCPSAEEDYRAVLSCPGTIPSKSAATVNCPDFTSGFCIVGYWTDKSFLFQSAVDSFYRQFLE